MFCSYWSRVFNADYQLSRLEIVQQVLGHIAVKDRTAMFWPAESLPQCVQQQFTFLERQQKRFTVDTVQQIVKHS